MTAVSKVRLKALLESRIETLARVEALAMRRSEALAAGRHEAVARLVEERETLVASLLESTADVEGLARSLEGTADAELLGLVDRAEELLRRIEAVDARDQAAIETAGARVQEELTQVSARERAGRAYRGAAPGSPAGGASGAGTSGNRVERSA